MTDKTHRPLIRVIYLYLFALLGLVLLTIGGVRFVDLGLRTFVFTKADEVERLARKMPPLTPVKIQDLGKTEKAGQKKVCLPEDEKVALEQYLKDYKNWKEKESKIDYLASRREKNISFNLAMILIGLPLYLYHWRLIKREAKNAKIVYGKD